MTKQQRKEINEAADCIDAVLHEHDLTVHQMSVLKEAMKILCQMEHDE